MKSFIFIILFSFSLLAKEASLGIVLGAPTGLSGKYKLSNSNALQLDLSSSYSALDYMWLSDENFRISNLEWSYGAGAIAKSGLGFRGVTNADYKLDDVPINVFGNISFNVYTDNDDKTSTFLGIAIGARYIF
jgi:hypothetical protein